MMFAYANDVSRWNITVSAMHLVGVNPSASYTLGTSLYTREARDIVGTGVPDGPKIVGEPLAAPVENVGRGLALAVQY